MTNEEFIISIQGFTAKKRAILTAISQGSTNKVAIESIGLAEKTLYNWCDKDADFKGAIANARDVSVNILEDVLTRCAAKALTDPRYQTSLIFLLKSRRRNIYGENRQIDVTSGGKEIKTIKIIDDASDEQTKE